MPNATLDPTSTGFYNGFGSIAGGAGTKVIAVTDDDDATYIYDASTGSTINQSFAIDDLPSEAVDVEQAGVDVVTRLGRSATPIAKRQVFMCDAAGTKTIGTGENFANDFPAAGWETLTVNIPTWISSSAHTIAALNAGQVGVAHDGAGGANQKRMNETHVSVDYIVDSGGFAYLISSFLAAMLGSSILLAQMPDIALELQRQSNFKRKLYPREFSQAYADLKAHPWRVYSWR